MRRVAELAGSAVLGHHSAGTYTDAAALLRQVAETVCGARTAGALHETLAAAWDTDAAGAALIRRALVLCADHELNASTFAVRVVASTGAASWADWPR
jgi:citrate synthase